MNVVVGKNYRVQNIQLSKISAWELSAPNLLTSGGSGAPPKQRSTKPSPDVGVRETHQPHSLTETFFRLRALRFGETSPALL